MFAIKLLAIKTLKSYIEHDAFPLFSSPSLLWPTRLLG